MKDKCLYCKEVLNTLEQVMKHYSQEHPKELRSLERRLNHYNRDLGCEIATHHSRGSPLCKQCPFETGCILEARFGQKKLRNMRILDASSDTKELADRFGVSQRTIQRIKKEG